MWGNTPRAASVVAVPCILPADRVILGTKEEIVISSDCQAIH